MTPSEDQVLDMARKIVTERGVSLSEAVAIAEASLAPDTAFPDRFTVTIPVRAKVARWVAAEFSGHPTLSVEDRLGEYLSIHLARARIIALRAGEAPAEVGMGRAVSVPRDKFKEGQE
jgi:hypothetical protein